MNRFRILGLVLLAALVGWFAIRTILPERAPPPPPAPAPAREAFIPTKPLRVEVLTVRDGQAEPDAPHWLRRELRHLLARGKMKLAPLDPAAAIAAFALRVTWENDGERARMELVAPDGVVDKSETLDLPSESNLARMQSLANRLPQFLSAPSGSADWSAALGTDDAAAYDAFLRAADELFAPQATGFTLPPVNAVEPAARLERLESLNKRQRTFARARALLALGYLSVGGEDEDSLTKLAEVAAERALSIDSQLADAQAALGIVRMRRMEWNAAQEHLDAALAIDASSIAALEGIGCLLMDVGRSSAALPLIARAQALQPGNRGARQCATLAAIATGTNDDVAPDEPADTARIHAAIRLLANDRPAAAALLRSSAAVPEELIRVVIDVTDSRSDVAEALRVLTRLADEKAIDAETEILFGAALRRPDFVFNRIQRLAKQNEAVPLRLMWLPQTEFLRKHRRFREVVSAATLTAYWQDHGTPDVCAVEQIHGGRATRR
jgi:Tfp pilus assembly protein PilF